MEGGDRLKGAIFDRVFIEEEGKGMQGMQRMAEKGILLCRTTGINEFETI